MTAGSVGVAESRDLDNWTKICDLPRLTALEENGFCAPGAIVLDGTVHLFYQTYGNGASDAICHAVSRDGIRFTPNETNPVFHPAGDWTCGRAIDADVIPFRGRLWLYVATRDPKMEIQKLAVASAPLDGRIPPRRVAAGVFRFHSPAGAAVGAEVHRSPGALRA